MRISLTKNVCIENLDKGISEFKRWQFEHSTYDEIYIIMSNLTLNKLAAEMNRFVIYHGDENWYSYKGYKVAINNSISYGEVEIR